MLFCKNAEKIGVLFLYYYIFFPQRSQSYIFSSCCTILTIDMVLPCFLLQKAGQGFLRSRKNSRWRRRKDLSLFVRIRCLCALVRGLENLETPCKGERVVTFCVVQKVTKKHARTCKKLPVASFCASETAETGRIANGREQGDHVSRSRRSPATSIQIAGRYGVFVKMTGIHQVTGYAENRKFSGYRRQ